MLPFSDCSSCNGLLTVPQMCLSNSKSAVVLCMEHSSPFPQISSWLSVHSDLCSKIINYRGLHWRNYLKWSFPSSIPQSVTLWPLTGLLFFYLSICNYLTHCVLVSILYSHDLESRPAHIFNFCWGNEQTSGSLKMSALPSRPLIHLFLLHFLSTWCMSPITFIVIIIWEKNCFTLTP